MKIIVNGAGGRMGKVLTDIIDAREGMEAVALVSLEFESCGNKYSNIEEYTGEADVIIDFSTHTSAKSLADYAIHRSIPMVVATTGHDDEELLAIQKATESVAVFKSANMSFGVAVLSKAAQLISQSFPDSDIEIVETHHTRKLDAPSGTAQLLESSIRQTHPKKDIGMHSLRLGMETGIHEIYFATDTEVITISHQAKDRSLFAEGALKAASFIVDAEPGLYDMNSLFD